MCVVANSNYDAEVGPLFKGARYAMHIVGMSMLDKCWRSIYLGELFLDLLLRVASPL
jgi:hypothetical protein